MRRTSSGMRRARLLIGVNVFWLALSLLVDGLNTLVLPHRLLALVGEAHQATVLGLITFVGLAVGAAVQPIAGAMSDRSRPRWGRRGAIGLGVLLALPSLALFGLAGGVIAALLGYLLVQIAASVAQAGQQALLPDLIATDRRGIAAGIKGFMDVIGATLGFVILGWLLGDGGTPLTPGQFHASHRNAQPVGVCRKGRAGRWSCVRASVQAVRPSRTTLRSRRSRRSKRARWPMRMACRPRP